MKKLSDVKDISSMISFLKERGENHTNYYHYTTWDSLTKIIQNKTFLLTRGNSLNINDQQEAHMKGSWREWNKIYIGSFAFGASENMAMWGLYGLPWQDAVRISISKEQMNSWINGITRVGLFENGQTIDYQSGFDVVLTDIVYAGGKRGTNNLRLTHYGKHITVSDTYPLYEIDTNPIMTGFIKNYAWHYENEVRLRIHLTNDTGYEKISVNIPDDIINSITVMTGPYFKWKNDKLYNNLVNENRIVESGFKNLVHYKELCDMCQYNSFVKKI